MPALYVMIKPVSGLCNMRCDYCFYLDEIANRKQGLLGIMTEETLEQIICKSLAFAGRECTFAWQGGEPLLAGSDFFELALKLQKKHNIHNVRIENVLQTNGLCINDDWGQFFAANSFLLGVSLDGIKSTHDAYRKTISGGDTYFRVMDSIRLLDRYNVQYNILTVVNSKTAPRIRKIYEQYRKSGFRYQQYIAGLDPVTCGFESHRAAAFDSQSSPGSYGYSLSPQSYGRFLIDLFELWEIDWYKGHQPYIRMFENWLGILLGEQPEACEQRGICGFQNVIESDGSVYPCDFYVLDGYCLGNLLHDSYETIYRRRLESGFIQQSENHGSECKTCKYFALCRGGCNRYRTAVEDGILVNRFCSSYRMFFDRCYDRLAKISSICRV